MNRLFTSSSEENRTVGTSEFIQWFRVLFKSNISCTETTNSKGKSSTPVRHSSVMYLYFSKRQSNWVSGIWMFALITVPTNWKPNGYIPNRPQHVFTFTFEHRNCGLIQISKPFRENLLEVLRAICYPQQPCAASQIFVPKWSASERKSPIQNEVRGR